MPEVNNNRGDYHRRRFAGPAFKPKGASQYWPNFHCRNGCGYNVPEDSAINLCPKCYAPLVRYLRWEVKGEPRRNSAIRSQTPQEPS